MSAVPKLLEIRIQLNSMIAHHMKLCIQMIKLPNDTLKMLPLISVLLAQLFTLLVVV